jgi:hypothetical protein
MRAGCGGLRSETGSLIRRLLPQGEKVLERRLAGRRKSKVVARIRTLSLRGALRAAARRLDFVSGRGSKRRVYMRTKLVGLLIGLSLAAVVAPALACEYGTSASNAQSSTQQTAESQPASQSGAN